MSLVLGSCTRTDWGTDDMRPVSCDDGRKTGSESDVDCGGLECQRCATGKACLADSDCASGQCTRGACEASHCSNLVKDRDEEGLDCGGQDCPSCGGSDPCANQRQDENETDVDCGGPSGCARCGAGDSCAADGDCLSHTCLGSICQDAGAGTGGASNTGGSGGRSGGETGGAGVGGASTGGTSGSSGGPSGGSGAFAGAPGDGGKGTGAGGGTAETGGSDNTGGQPGTGGAAAGEGGAGAPSTGGTEPAGGEGGAGGATGGSGGTSGGGGTAGGTGGSTGAGGTAACSDSPISGDGLITDFSEFTPGMNWTSGERTWGNEDLSGTTQHYGSSGVMLTAAITSGGNLRLTSTIPNLKYVGLALDFRTCSDASAFTGISVTIQGDTAGSSLFLQLETSRNMPNDLPGGQCEFTSEATRWDDCSYNRVAIADITATSRVVELSWSQFTGGVPITPVDEAELLGMQLQFQCFAGADCAIDVTITEIRFLAP